MTKHFNVGEAKAKLSQLIAAAVRGEDVVIDHDGRPQVRLVAVGEAREEEGVKLAAKRRAFIGSWAKAFEGYDTSVEALKGDRDYSPERRKLHGDDLR